MKPAQYLSFALLFTFPLVEAGAVEKDVSGVISFNTIAPTNSDIANWTTGWGTAGVTGWNYVGTVNGASGVYLGNNWVLTAGHVGAGTFSLSGTSYSVVAGSVQGILNTDGTPVDLTLFRLTLAPNLPSLTVASSAPVAFSQSQGGSSVAMIGYGGGQGQTWGLNTATQIDQSIFLSGYGYTSTDFVTDYGSFGHGPSSFTNNYTLIVGDSGGADFIFDSTASKWVLSGINEAVDSNKNSYLVELSAYASQINSITAAVPEPSSFGLLGLGLLALLFKRPKS